MDLRKVEDEAISRLYQYLDIFQKFERPLSLLLKRKYPPEEILEAEGKKCVIRVSGLRYHDLTVFFQVTGLSIKRVEPFDNFDTFIQCPISTVNTFFSRLLAGDETAFGDLSASGEVKFMGKKTYHDIMVFESACKLLAENIKRLRG